MKLLLDTHCFLWWILDNPSLSQTARDAIAEGGNGLYWSAASSWELSIKYALGRLPLPEPPEWFFPPELIRHRVASLPIADEHAFQAGQLPVHHRDPFDRMLVAQSRAESMVLVSNDAILRRYDVELLW